MHTFRQSLVLALTLALFGVGPVHAAPLARVIAVVNGDMITARELDKAVAPEIAFKKLDPESPGDAAQIEALKRQTLEAMINQHAEIPHVIIGPTDRAHTESYFLGI